MSQYELPQSLEEWQYLAFRITQAVIFIGALCQLVDKHFRVKESLLKLARQLFDSANKSDSANKQEIL